MQTNKPIFINLSGSEIFGDAKLIGNVASDPRLIALDAFLNSLAESSEEMKSNMASMFRSVVDKCPEKILADRDLVIEVTSSIDPKRHEIVHKFRITAPERVR